MDQNQLLSLLSQFRVKGGNEDRNKSSIDQLLSTQNKQNNDKLSVLQDIIVKKQQQDQFKENLNLKKAQIEDDKIHKEESLKAAAQQQAFQNSLALEKEDRERQKFKLDQNKLDSTEQRNINASKADTARMFRSFDELSSFVNKNKQELDNSSIFNRTKNKIKGSLFGNSKEFNQLENLTTSLAENMVKVRGWPNTQSSLNAAKQMLSPKKGENPNEYLKRLKHEQKDIFAIGKDLDRRDKQNSFEDIIKSQIQNVQEFEQNNPEELSEEINLNNNKKLPKVLEQLQSLRESIGNTDLSKKIATGINLTGNDFIDGAIEGGTGFDLLQGLNSLVSGNKIAEESMSRVGGQMAGGLINPLSFLGTANKASKAVGRAKKLTNLEQIANFIKPVAKAGAAGAAYGARKGEALKGGVTGAALGSIGELLGNYINKAGSKAKDFKRYRSEKKALEKIGVDISPDEFLKVKNSAKLNKNPKLAAKAAKYAKDSVTKPKSNSDNFTIASLLGGNIKGALSSLAGNSAKDAFNNNKDKWYELMNALSKTPNKNRIPSSLTKILV